MNEIVTIISVLAAVWVLVMMIKYAKFINQFPGIVDEELKKKKEAQDAEAVKNNEDGT